MRLFTHGRDRGPTVDPGLGGSRRRVGRVPLGSRWRGRRVALVAAMCVAAVVSTAEGAVGENAAEVRAFSVRSPRGSAWAFVHFSKPTTVGVSAPPRPRTHS